MTAVSTEGNVKERVPDKICLHRGAEWGSSRALMVMKIYISSNDGQRFGPFRSRTLEQWGSLLTAGWPLGFSRRTIVSGCHPGTQNLIKRSYRVLPLVHPVTHWRQRAAMQCSVVQGHTSQLKVQFTQVKMNLFTFISSVLLYERLTFIEQIHPVHWKHEHIHWPTIRSKLGFSLLFTLWHLDRRSRPTLPPANSCLTEIGKL